MIRRCLVCEQEITEDQIGVYDATVWHSSGNYGSGVYDPSGEDVFLEAVICDACLVRKKSLLEEVVIRCVHDEVERRPPAF
jgi:hypothetical protein